MAQDTPPSTPQPGSMPDWLRQSMSDPPPENTSNPASDPLPDWFSTLDQSDESPAAPAPSASGTAKATPIDPAEAFPDWFTASQTSTPGALPISEENAPLGLPAESPRTLKERAYDPRPIPQADADLPAWMREMAPEEKLSQPITPPQPSTPAEPQKSTPASRAASPAPAAPKAAPQPPKSVAQRPVTQTPAAPPAPAVPVPRNEPSLSGLLGRRDLPVRTSTR